MMIDDSSIGVSVDDIRTFENLKLISEISPVKDRIRSFENKHGCNIAAFEARLKQLPEDFELWDDFIEWKAYEDRLKDLESKLKKDEMILENPQTTCAQSKPLSAPRSC